MYLYPECSCSIELLLSHGVDNASHKCGHDDDGNVWESIPNDVLLDFTDEYAVSCFVLPMYTIESTYARIPGIRLLADACSCWMLSQASDPVNNLIVGVFAKPILNP